jgi:hypothetical protein
VTLAFKTSSDRHDPGHYFTATAAYEGADKGTGDHDGAADEEASSLFACRIASKVQMCAMISESLREIN